MFRCEKIKTYKVKILLSSLRSLHLRYHLTACNYIYKLSNDKLDMNSLYRELATRCIPLVHAGRLIGLQPIIDSIKTRAE